MKKLRTSENGFYCAVCNKFVFAGFDTRDKKDLPGKQAVCEKCGEEFEDVE